MSNSKWLEDLREEERRLERQLAYVRQQIRNIEYQDSRAYYISNDYDWFGVMFGERKDEE